MVADELLVCALSAWGWGWTSCATGSDGLFSLATGLSFEPEKNVLTESLQLRRALDFKWAGAGAWGCSVLIVCLESSA